ncbi:hypothetical protein [Paraliobacillus salinarum]|uniref:hypothetical protein n=1 Tax=Paraliobacillus salinarum TaxID=1158996 RepID=UPI001FE2E2A5|nr:hypothetical protein [Paraliobacillus salinarum]
MYVCLVCNGMESITSDCKHCGGEMIEEGKVTNQFGDYSPYMDDDSLKLVDGDIYSKNEHLCLHLLRCSTCNSYLQVALEEQYIR